MSDYRDVFRGTSCMITGGLGFVGSNLARTLLDAGAKVMLVDSLIPEYGGNRANIADIQDRVQINIADVRDEYAIQHLVRNQHYIFNLAGQVSHFNSMEEPGTDLDINCRAQLSMLEACKQYNPEVKIVYACTRQIYGRPLYLPIDERHPVQPIDVNGINKMAGEWYHILYNNVYGIRSSSLRLTNTYGPRMLVRHNRQTAIGWFIKLVLDNAEIQIYGDGSQLRDYNYVDDVVDAFLRAAAFEQANGQIYNLGGRRPISHNELVSTLIEIAGSGAYRCVPWPPEKAKIDIGDVYSSYSRIQIELGWEPQVDLRSGLERTVAFYKEHREAYW